MVFYTYTYNLTLFKVKQTTTKSIQYKFTFFFLLANKSQNFNIILESRCKAINITESLRRGRRKPRNTKQRNPTKIQVEKQRLCPLPHNVVSDWSALWAPPLLLAGSAVLLERFLAVRCVAASGSEDSNQVKQIFWQGKSSCRSFLRAQRATWR